MHNTNHWISMENWIANKNDGWSSWEEYIKKQCHSSQIKDRIICMKNEMRGRKWLSNLGIIMVLQNLTQGAAQKITGVTNRACSRVLILPVAIQKVGNCLCTVDRLPKIIQEFKSWNCSLWKQQSPRMCSTEQGDLVFDSAWSSCMPSLLLGNRQ